MRCPDCDYSLWNLQARACPECGRDFRPSEFTFAANSVRYCCPGCDQAYYGTTDTGHLDPPEFDCVQCGRHLVADDMVVRPRDDVREQDTVRVRMPWLERDRSGRRVRAWLSTVGMSLGQPIRLMAAAGPQSSLGQAWWFAVLTQLLTSVVVLAPLLLFAGVLGAAVSNTSGGPSAGRFLGGFAAAGGIGLAIILAGSIVWLVIWGGVTHVMLVITGGAAHPIGQTYRALCYSSGANVLTAIPCVGQYIGPVWWIVSGVLMVREGQRVHGGRATLAVLAAPVVAFLAFLALYAWFLVFAIAASNAATGGFVQSDAGQVTSALDTHRLDDGTLPAHPLMLVDAMGTSGFVMTDTPTWIDDIVLDEAGTTLEQIDLMGDGEREAYIASFVAGADPSWTELRIGDIVFVYNGIDPEVDAAALWTYILAEEQSPSVRVLGRPVFWAVSLDGTVVPVTEPVDGRIDAQNALRAGHGLSPISDPRRVPSLR